MGGWRAGDFCASLLPNAMRGAVRCNHNDKNMGERIEIQTHTDRRTRSRTREALDHMSVWQLGEGAGVSTERWGRGERKGWKDRAQGQQEVVGMKAEQMAGEKPRTKIKMRAPRMGRTRECRKKNRFTCEWVEGRGERHRETRLRTSRHHRLMCMCVCVCLCAVCVTQTA